MHRQARFLVLATMVAACSDATDSVLAPQFGAQPSADLAVNTTVADADATVAPSFQIRSDNLGVYRNSSTLTSKIQSIGDYLLDSVSPRNSTRKVFLDFSQPVAGSAPGGANPTAIPSGLYKVHMIAKCNLYGGNMRTIPVGSTVACPLHVGQVTVGSTEYAVQMNPRASATGATYPTTNFVDVKCVSAGATGSCAQWRITPNGSVTNPDGTVQFRNVAKLLKQTKTGSIDMGDFYMSFAINLSL